ncbi:MAG: hypothetical protein NZ954_01210 [Thermofilaceae archaeon]|nr:hypothetical protein [Thermofilaceae archaeon]MCX8180512.1 hypothetical protein [Thermofilaceae archaeon]MDW8003291.1 hypothetical protein [Thermofilaceae archaeon]
MFEENIDKFFERVDIVCQTAATFLATIRKGYEDEVIKRLSRRARQKLKLGSALMKYDYKGQSLTYVAPDRLIIRLNEAGTLEDAKVILNELMRD